MDRKTLIAILISLVIWLAWQRFYWDPYQKAREDWEKAQKLHQVEKSFLQEKDSEAPQKEVEIKRKKADYFFKKILSKTENISLTNASVDLSNSSELFQNWKLNKFFTDKETKQKKKIDFKYVTGFAQQLNLNIYGEDFQSIQHRNWEVVFAKENTYKDRLKTETVQLERTVQKGKEAYALDLNYKIEFKKIIPSHIFLSLYGRKNRENDKEGSFLSGYPDLLEVTYINREGRESVQVNSLEDNQKSSSGANWLALNTKYFLLALIPQDKKLRSTYGVKVEHIRYHDIPAVKGTLIIPTEGKKILSVPLKIFFGPKQIESLEKVDKTLPLSIDFGWTSFLAIPLLKMLKWFFSYSGNYGISIIFLTIVIKILLFPITYKGMKSMAALPKLRPQMEQIQKKYKKDKQRLQKEMLNLYRVNKVNPVSGCFSILLQMPIFFALFRLLFNCVELYQSPFVFWIQDLSVKDPYYVLPVLLIVFMYLQQAITPMTTTDPNQKTIMRLIPIIFGVFMLFLPAGLNIYTLVNVIFSAGQQHILNKKFNTNFAPEASKSKKKEEKKSSKAELTV